MKKVQVFICLVAAFVVANAHAEKFALNSLSAKNTALHAIRVPEATIPEKTASFEESSRCSWNDCDCGASQAVCTWNGSGYAMFSLRTSQQIGGTWHAIRECQSALAAAR